MSIFLMYNFGESMVSTNHCEMSDLRPLHSLSTHETAILFLRKSMRKSLLILKTVEKIVAVVKKSCSVYGR